MKVEIDLYALLVAYQEEASKNNSKGFDYHTEHFPANIPLNIEIAAHFR